MNVAFTLGRIALVVVFVFSGVQKLFDIAGTADQIQTKITIPAISTSREHASTPSTRSVRLSLHGLERVSARRAAALLPDPLPAGAAI